MLDQRVQKRFPFLTGQQKKIAEHILSLGHEAAFFTISQLARQFRTSQSAIVRFARALGYKGYPDLQKDLQEGIRRKLSPPEALESSMAKARGADIYSRIFGIEQENLRKTRELNNNLALDRAIREIIRARRGGIIGFRSSHPIAYLLYLLLSQVRKNCDLLEFTAGSLARIASCAKHYLADGGTQGGVDQGNTVADEAAIREIHLPGYVSAVDAGVATVMASFSSINGQKMHGSAHWLTDVLKTELGFTGVVVSDWAGVTSWPPTTRPASRRPSTQASTW